ncbi:MAG: TonB-dependent receptor [Pseudomonadales bacterium]|nr:TonB-dependent receptor [Halioglobus sp.]MCP5131393.1 TonB-dependent receptor [Pseudomonadales bacterium]
MSVNPMRKFAAVACFAPVALFPWVSAPVHAESLALEEVIVTARKRDENLQETPVAVTALDATALRDAGVKNLSNLNQIAPNIEVQSANGNSGAANIYIRGVGQRNTGPNIDSGVGIYLDGVYIGRPDGALLDVVDMQSVQVLRGPQGTLFGKNTTAGALVFTTNKPTDEFEGQVGTRVGNYDRLDGDVMLNVPLLDDLWTRLSGAYRSADGYIDNEYDGKKYMNEDRNTVIWQTRWAPGEDWLLDLNLNYAKTNQRARPQKCRLVEGYEGWQANLLNTLAVVPATGRTYEDFCEDSANAGGGDKHTVISDLGGKYQSTNKGASLTVDWDLNEHLGVKSISAYRYTEARQDDDLDNSGIPFLHRTMTVHPTYDGPAKTDQYSQEFQLTGDMFDERLQYVTGLFWFNEKTDGNVSVSYLGPFDPAISDLFFLNSAATDLDADNTATAAFAQGEWAFDEHWRATVGVRYTDEKRKLKRDRYLPVPASLDLNGGPVSELGGGLYAVQRPGFVYNPDFELALQDKTRAKLSGDDVTPMASLQYMMEENDWVDLGTFYLTYSEGFLSGGLSEAPTGELDTYKPEEVTSWELGFKLDMLERRLRMNGALYYTDYKNRQLTTVVINPVNGNPAPDTINAAKSSITGFELETTWLATENLTLSFNFTINDGDIETFDDTQLTLGTGPAPPPGCTRENLVVVNVDSCPNDRSDENLPRLPKQTYYLAAQYDWEMELGTVTPRLQASLKHDIEYCFDSASCRTGMWYEDEQFDLSARLNWVSPDQKWLGALYCNNITDTHYQVGGTALVEPSGAGGYSVATPRMYGLELEYRF